LIDAAGKSGTDLKVFAKEYLAVRYYDAGVSVPLTVTVNNFEETLDFKSYFLKLSDYNAVMSLEGREPITLSADEYAVNFAVTNASVRGTITDYMKNAGVITLRGAKLKTDESRLYTHTLEVLKNQDYNLTVVVRDELTEGLPVFRDVLHINYLGQTGEDEKICLESLSKMKFGAGTATFVQTKSDVLEFSNSATTVVSYLAVYLGIIFLIAAAAVLAIGQLSETSDNITRYGLLRKIGADDKMLNRALFVQILIYFGAPALLALVHTAVGIVAVSRMVSAFAQGSIVGSALFTAAALLVIYGGYFLATYTGGKNILNRDYARDC
jgi:putative ABC transport system permease protein